MDAPTLLLYDEHKPEKNQMKKETQQFLMSVLMFCKMNLTNKVKKQDLECSKEVEHNWNSETNDSNKDNLSESISENTENKNNTETGDSWKMDSSEKKSEEIEHNKNSESNWISKDDLSQNISEEMELSDNSKNKLK